MKKTLAKKEFNEMLMDRAFLFSIVVQFILVSMLLFIYVSYSQISKTNVPITVTINSNETELISSLKDSGVNVIVTEGGENPAIPKTFSPNAAAAAIDTSAKTVKTDPSNIMSGFAIAKIKSASEKVSFDQALSNNNFTYSEDRVFQGSAEFVQMGYGMLIPICIILPAVVAMSISTSSIFTERKRNTIELLLVSPITNLSLTLYKVFPLVGVSVVCSLAWLLLVSTAIPISSSSISAFGFEVFVSNIWLLLAVSFSISVLMVSLSVVVSCKSKTVREANAFSSIVGMFIMVSLVLPYNPLVVYTPTSVMARAASSVLDNEMLIGSAALAFVAFLSFLWAKRAVGELRESYT
jgi:ABC-type Na+ efflux pump permease subunit